MATLTVLILTPSEASKAVDSDTYPMLSKLTALLDQQPWITEVKTIATNYTSLRNDHTDSSIDFAAVRNKALQQVTTDWFLFLDSDEIPDTDFLDSCADFFGNQINTPYTGIAVKRVDMFLGKKIAFGEVGTAQFIRGGKTGDWQWIRPVHEVLVPIKHHNQDKNKDKDKHYITQKPLVYMPHGCVQHHSHQSTQQFINKVSAYALIEAEHRYQTKQISSKGILLAQLLLYPLGKFFYNFLVQQGYRDGFRGCIYAFCMSLHSYLVRIYLWELTYTDKKLAPSQPDSRIM